MCKQFYEMSLHTVLEEGKWPFATVEEPVERIELDDYAKEQRFVYRIPANAVLVVGLSQRFRRKHMRKGIDWDIRYIPSINEKAIICNLESLTSEEIDKDIDQDEQILIEYICATDESSSYSTSFIRCLVAQLAADMAMPITHDQQRFATLMQYAEQMKSKALQQNLNEDGQDKMHWLDPITASRGW